MIDKSIFTTLVAAVTDAKEAHEKAYRQEVDTREALRTASNALMKARVAYVRERVTIGSELETVKHGRISIVDVRAYPYQPNLVMAVFQTMLKNGKQWGKTRYTDSSVAWDFETDRWTGTKAEYHRAVETLR